MDWRSARAILCVRLDYLGDVLMTSPALRALKDGDPARKVVVLTSPAGAEAARLIPEVDGVIAYDAPWLKATAARRDAGPDFDMIQRLKAEGFDAAVIFTVYSQSPLPAALLCYLAGIPLRVAHCHENPYQLLTNWLPDPEPQQYVRHEVRRQLDLVGALGFSTPDERLSLRLPRDAIRQTAELLSSLAIDLQGRWAVLHAGGSAPSRRYPMEHWTAVAQQLSAEGWQMIFTGGPEDAPLIETISDGLPAHSLAGKLTLAELAALIARAPLLVSGNTGPVHIAAAVSTPVVDLYALTNPQHTPWQVPSRVLSHDVPCKYCYRSVCPEGHHQCLRLVRPEQVVRAVHELAPAR